MPFMHKREPLSRHVMLATPIEQVKLLEETECGILPFSSKLDTSGHAPLRSSGIDILQINIGYTCNLHCRHCHVDAGPERREMMTRQNMEYCLDALDKSSIKTIDITGGTPEINPEFYWLIENIRSKVPDAEILVRSNLTLLEGNNRYSHIPEFLKQHRVTIIASLPCTTREKVDTIRGEGVFDRSINALKLLNSIGYSQGKNGLDLNLVYNPEGPFLPEDQQHLEHEFRKFLLDNYGIVFSHLYTITNMPINRFLNNLLENGQFCEYMALLAKNFNPEAVRNLMCRSTVSVGWDGTLYDCDFNQMLHLPVAKDAPQHISEFNEESLKKRLVASGQHCYGCTAGAGSSCQGSLV